MPEPMNLPGLRLARLGYDAQVAVREQRARLRTPIHPRRDARELRMLRIGTEDKGPVAAFRWRGMPGEDAALARLRGVGEAAGRVGFLAGRVAAFAGGLGAVR
jgi:hypothetical protein